MNFDDALPTLLERLAAGGDVALFSERELSEWPAAAVALLKAERLLVKGPPADAVTCPGCEDDCTMPVGVATTSSGAMRAFVVCDKRDDVGRVVIAPDMLEQWTSSPGRVADALARTLGLRRGSDGTGPHWDIGVLKGVKYSAHVVLGIGRALQLEIAGHRLPVADVLELGDTSVILERRALVRCVDNPVAGAGDTESSMQRRERLKARVHEEKAKGNKAFFKTVAAEENISSSRLKQLVAEKSPPFAPRGVWSGLLPVAKGAGSKKGKAKA